MSKAWGFSKTVTIPDTEEASKVFKMILGADSLLGKKSDLVVPALKKIQETQSMKVPMTIFV
jgi:hypothetical protein